ncbi:MAG: hypothetical protein ACJ8A0_20425 [Microvirga sp.]
MKTVQSGDAIWLTRAQAGAPRSLRRQRANVLARAACVAGLLTGAAAGLAPADAPATAAAAPAAPAALSAALAKEEARLASTPASRVIAAVPAASARAAAVARPVDPRFAALPTQARFAKAGEPAVTGSLVPGGFAPAPGASEWRNEEFAQIQALDGRTLAASSVRIRLAGLELPGAGEVCRTLDGRLEPCLARAATQLELITRFRKVSCRYRIEAPGEASGSCRIGTTDLAERMARTGFAKRAPEAGRLALAAAATGVN